MQIVIGSDHGGFELKTKIINQFPNINFIDSGCFDENAVDYPDVSDEICKNITSETDYVLSICGSGFGITNAVLKQIDLQGLILKSNKQYDLIIKNNLKVIGFGARTTDNDILINFLNKIS